MSHIAFQNEFIPVVVSDQNFRSRTFHKYHVHVKEVRAHSDMKLGMWIGWAGQLTHVFDLLMLLPHFHSRMRTFI